MSPSDGAWLVALSCFLLTSCGSDSPPCELGAQLAARAGGGAKDCGHALLDSDPAPVNTCVVDSFGNHASFVAQIDQRGIDSRVITGIARDTAGQLTFLSYDGDPSGGGGARPRIDAFVCVNPSIDMSSSPENSQTAPFVCESQKAIGVICGGP
jgi:hypothetical protein